VTRTQSTFFNVLCKQQADAQNFPFCTIDPNTSQCIVPDERFDYLVKHYHPKSEVPAVLKVTDIAGLVKGAAEGQGLGNAFLSHIAAVDGIYHMVRCFEDSEVAHVETTVDPVRDLEIIAGELRAKDIQTMNRRLESVSAGKRNTDKAVAAQYAMEEKFLALLNEGKDIRGGDWDAKEIELLNEIQLLTAKPVIVLINLSEADYVRRKNKWLVKIKEWVDAHGADPIIPLSCAVELKFADCQTPEETAKLAAEIGCQSALPKIITSGYHRLHLIHFFTAGSDEVKCWTLRKGAKAPQAAGTIHSDFEKGFICAEVMAFEDFKAADGKEADVKKAGKHRQQGREHVVNDGEIIVFKHGNISAGKK
jgi:obg-like ATPase 1